MTFGKHRNGLTSRGARKRHSNIHRYAVAGKRANPQEAASSKPLLPAAPGSGGTFLNSPVDKSSQTGHTPASKEMTGPGNTYPAGNASYKEINAFIEREMDRLKIPGAALAIVEDGQIVHFQGFGRSRPGGPVPTPQTTFFVGSTTKAITATAVIQLVEAGKIALDDPVQRYLPWFRFANAAASTRITVRHLLNQTSGLSVWTGWVPLAHYDDAPDASERACRSLATFLPKREAGAGFEYSNMNYSLLGLVIEAASGETYEAYIQNHVLGPLEMNHTRTRRAGPGQNGVAAGHCYWFGFPAATHGLGIPRSFLAGGGLISTAEDMAHFLIAHLNEGHYRDVQILSPSGIAELHRPAATAGFPGATAMQYAMGWYTEEHGPARARRLWHTGIVPDFFAYMALLPDQKKGVIILFNAYHFLLTPALTEIGLGVTALLVGEKPLPPRFTIPSWTSRSLLLIPVLQIAGMLATLRLICHLRHIPQTTHNKNVEKYQYIIPPLLLNIPVALCLVPMLGKIGGFLRLYMPDISRLAVISGSFAAVWSFVRTVLILRAFRAKTGASGCGKGGPDQAGGTLSIK